MYSVVVVGFVCDMAVGIELVMASVPATIPAEAEAYFRKSRLVIPRFFPSSLSFSVILCCHQKGRYVHENESCDYSNVAMKTAEAHPGLTRYFVDDLQYSSSAYGEKQNCHDVQLDEPSDPRSEDCWDACDETHRSEFSHACRFSNYWG